MAHKDYSIQIKYWDDDPQKFKAATAVVQRAAREVYAALRVLAGPGQPKPKVQNFSDDYEEGIKDESTAGKALDEPSDPNAGQDL